MQMNWNLSGEIAYQQNGEGRSGHKLKDLFTAAILSELFNLRLIGGRCWNQNFIVRFPPSGKSSATRRVDLRIDTKRWGGISEAEFDRLAQTLRDNHGPDVLFVLHGVYRIHLYQVHQWEHDGVLPPGSFTRCIDRLRELYWGSGAPEPAREERIAIHVRRGDVADPSHPEYNKMGPGLWSAVFYGRLTSHLRELYPGKQITLYSEPRNAEDLQTLKHVEVELGGPATVQSHFHKMVTAGCFVPACSSLSTWIAYSAQGNVLIPDLPIKHFDHPRNLFNWERV